MRTPGHTPASEAECGGPKPTDGSGPQRAAGDPVPVDAGSRVGKRVDVELGVPATGRAGSSQPAAGEPGLTVPVRIEPTFACHACGGPLNRRGESAMECAADGTAYRRIRGIWDMVPPEDRSRYERFVDEYDCIRRHEGRGSTEAEYFRALPCVPFSSPFRYDWQIRRRTYRTLVDRVVRPMEDRRLRILDVGAGNGWLSNRMAERGHEAVAVDLRTGTMDGLGAHVHYAVPFTCVRADFDRLPLPEGRFDLVIFNASFHYSTCYERTLAEAIRVLAPGGRVVVADTPVYGAAAAGAAMVAERRRRFEARYGFASDAVAAEEYLTSRRLLQLAARLGVTWTWYEPRYGPRWTIRRLAGRFRNGRESARFGLAVARIDLDASTAVAQAVPNRYLRPLARRALRLKYHLVDRPRRRGTVDESVGGIALRIPPDVFNPVLFRTGAFLAETLMQGVLPDGARVLDLGTGSGVCGIAAAMQSADVLAADIQPKAVACAAENARRNDATMRTHCTDLFEGLGRFDVVLFNPPFFAGRPVTPFEYAWQSEGLVSRFADELRNHLTAGGFALVVLSTDGACPEYLQRFESVGYRLALVRERRYLTETLSIYRLADAP